MNLLLAVVGMFLMMTYSAIMGISLSSLLFYQFDMVTLFWFLFITMNLALAVFNLLPIPPLDGYRLIKVFWRKGGQWMEQHMLIITIALLIIILLPGA